MTYRNLLPNLLAAIAILASPAAALAAQPQWLSENPQNYPTATYLIGRGTGSTADEAQNRARGDLATIFEVRIEVLNQNTLTSTQSGNKEQVDRIASQQVSAKTDKVISGISIAEVWRDPVTQDFHALAVLPRAQASTSLREALASIDASLNQQMQAAQSAADLLLKVGALSQALQSAIKREGYQAMLKVIDPSGRGVPAPVSQDNIQQQIGDTLKQVRISPRVIEDAGSGEFAGLIKGGLAAAGFLASQQSGADFVLESKLTLNDLGHIDGWNWMRGTVEIALVEKATGRVRGSKTWPFKASARDAKTARSRSLQEIEKLLKEELRTTIIAFAAS